MEKTAVEWLFDNIREKGLVATLWNEKVIQQAKEMEKQQIIKAASTAYEDMFGTDGTEYGEEYYNNTFKNK